MYETPADRTYCTGLSFRGADTTNPYHYLTPTNIPTPLGYCTFVPRATQWVYSSNQAGDVNLTPHPERFMEAQ